MSFKNKNILLVGLGVLGGGLAIAKFLLKQGAKLTVTDLRTKKELDPVLQKLKGKKIKFVLGKHNDIDFKNNDIIVFNPAVSIFSGVVEMAKKLKKPIENDLTLFLKNKSPDVNYISITGTRGKTTTTFWIRHFLGGRSVLGGNIPEKGLLKIVDKKAKPFVLELSSFQLEFMKKSLPAPKIAVITNLYSDHLNRYRSLKTYLKIKAKIFLNQTKKDFLILNADNKHTKEFLKEKPKSKVYYFSLKKLSAGKNGLFFDGSNIYFQKNGNKKFITNVNNTPDHQKSNLLAALLAAYLYRSKPAHQKFWWAGKWSGLVQKIKSLPSVKFRQEVIFENKNLKIVNDSAATSPDATIAALDQLAYSGNQKYNVILITGGTDKNLKFRDLAYKIKEHINSRNLFLLQGNATTKLTKELEKAGYFGKNLPQLFGNLEEIFGEIKERKRLSGVICFSPAAASFEKFKNEFERGKEFNRLVKKNFNGGFA